MKTSRFILWSNQISYITNSKISKNTITTPTHYLFTYSYQINARLHWRKKQKNAILTFFWGRNHFFGVESQTFQDVKYKSKYTFLCKFSWLELLINQLSFLFSFFKYRFWFIYSLKEKNNNKKIIQVRLVFFLFLFVFCFF